METIPLECLSDDVEQTDECAVGDKSELDKLIRFYLDESDRVTRVANSEAVNFYSRASEISTETVKTAHQGAASIEVTATECIAAL